MATTAYQNSLYQASWRGFPFTIKETDDSYGRKLADHDYPFRDVSWQEDMGKKNREFEIRGFIQGNDVLAQETYLISLVELPGPGILIHPKRGICNVTLMGFHSHSHADDGNKIEFSFMFKEAGSNIFPSIVTSGFGAIAAAIDNLFGAGSSDFVASVAGAVKQGADVVAKGVSTITTFTATGGALIKGSSNLFNQVSSLSGSFGRFAGGATGSGSNGVNGPVLATGAIATQIQNLIAQGAASRSAVGTAAEKLIKVADEL